jgi:EpsD family peptidyl-prolyl cis-trans isomerase
LPAITHDRERFTLRVSRDSVANAATAREKRFEPVSLLASPTEHGNRMSAAPTLRTPTTGMQPRIASGCRAPAPRPLAAVAVLACALVAACSPAGRTGDSSSTQVAVKVNGGEISVHQVEHAVQRHAALAAANDGTRRVLDGLVDQELAAQQAREKHLDRDPRTVQAIEAARRDILARAYVESVGQAATQPDTQAVDDYYARNPALFAQRRLYVLQEMMVEGDASALAALGERVRSLASAEAIINAAHEVRLVPTVHRTARPAEDIALSLVERLGALRDGQSLWLPGEKSAKVITVITSQPAPLGRIEARPRIQAFLAAERQREAVTADLKHLRQKARIEYLGRFAPPADASAAPAAVTAQR